MLKGIYTVKDKVSGVSVDLFVAVNNATAVRDLRKTVNTEGNTISSNPDDFTLIRLGEFDNEVPQVLGNKVLDDDGKVVLYSKVVIEASSLVDTKD